MSNQKLGREPSQPTQARGNQAGVDRMSGRGAAPNKRNGSASITSQVQETLDQQVARGARMITNVARSARRAADELETDAPQIAGLVRGMADRAEEYSRSLEHQSVTDIYEAASDFTRRQPAAVFGIAALAGFFALRTLKSSQTSSASSMRASRPGSEELRGS
jgi:ElaB/YqjD/DUF883 family membrane-anchored ribosome-binding protein